MSSRKGITEMLMINEIMSRARMREPQNIPSEASRSARQIAASARRRQANDLSSR
jgi:hypothetical protein